MVPRWDCISIDEKPVDEALFREVEAQVLERNKKEKINATEFELLTATAFDIFTKENVDVGVVEVGMGGREDATNVLKSKAVTVIARIGLDHQAFLGDTVEQIAKEKCGIFRPGVPVIYVASNLPSVVDVIEAEADSAGAGPLYMPKRLPPFGGNKYKAFGKKLVSRREQRLGIACAYQALQLLHPMPKQAKTPEKSKVFDAIMSTVIPGRAQLIDISALVGVEKKIMVDGAHNAQAAENLRGIVWAELRDQYVGPVTWVLASTKGKDLPSILTHLLTNGDSLAAVEFGSVDGMPWVHSTPSHEIVDAAQGVTSELAATQAFGKDITGALEWAVNKAEANPIVVTGSLYLVSDVFRLLRDAEK
jgi:folylpolyglutamate synthase/dihydrofolate synthase